MNVLILDDDAKFRRQLRDEMQRSGHRLMGFDAWPSALAFLESDRPADLMVTELEFSHPGPNGVSFAHMALRRRPGIGILFVSSSTQAAREVDQRLGQVLLKATGLAQIVKAVLAMERRPSASHSAAIALQATAQVNQHASGAF